MNTRPHHALHPALLVLLWAASGILMLVSYWTGASGDLYVFLLTGLAAVALAILAYRGRPAFKKPDPDESPKRNVGSTTRQS